MTGIEKETILALTRTLMTTKQITFCYAYIKCGKMVKGTMNELHCTDGLVYQNLKSKQIMHYLSIYDMPITEGAAKDTSDSTPTLEYLNDQWTILYKRALDAHDDRVAAQILDKRMKYYVMFEDLRKEDKINLSKLTINELVAMETERHKATMELLTAGQNNEWKKEAGKNTVALEKAIGATA